MMTNLPSIKNLTYLLAVYKHHNFSKAARACFVSQSTLSAGISKLEQDLRTVLILRDNKSVAFTPIGKRVVNVAQQTILSAQNLVQIGNTDFFEGELTIGSIPTITPFILHTLQHTIRERYPKLTLTLIENQSEFLLKQIATMDIDFALFALPFELPQSIAFHVLFEEKLWPIHHKNRSLDTLDDNCVLLLEHGHCLREHILSNTAVIKPKHIAKTSCSNLATLVSMVSLDMGVSFLPEMAIKNGILNAYPDVCINHKAEFSSSRQIGVVYRQNYPQADNIIGLINQLNLNQ